MKFFIGIVTFILTSDDLDNNKWEIIALFILSHPFEYWGEGRSQIAFSIVVLTILLIADYYIYKNSDSYLR